MALGNTTLELLITAKDNASAAIAKVAGEAEAAGKSVSSSSGGLKEFADKAGSAFDTMAGSIERFAMKTAALGLGGAFSASYFINLAGQLDTTQRQMAVLTGSTEAANKVFGELYNYTLGKPIAFPDASKAAETLLGYGRSIDTVQSDMETLSKLSIVNGGDLQNLAVVFGQVTSRGALFGQDALQLINNNVPLTTILAKHFGITMEEASKKINGGTVSAQEFTQAMKEYADSLDIGSMQDSFKNRMISLEGSLRSTGLAILGIKIDPVKGFVVDSEGLFARFSDAVQNVTKWLKDNKDTIVDVGKVILENFVPAIAGIASAWTGLKIASWVTSLGSLINPFTILAGVVAIVSAAIGILYVSNSNFRDSVNDVAKKLGDLGKQIADYLWPKLQDLWKTIRDDLIPVLADAWKKWLGPLASFLMDVFVTAIGGVVDALNGTIRAFTYVYKKIEEGSPFWTGLIAVLAIVAGAIALSSAFAAFQAGMALITTVIIPGVASAFGGLATLIASPIVMGAIAVAGAIADIMLVYNAVMTVKGAIESMNAAASMAAASASAGASLRGVADRQLAAGKISQQEHDRLYGIANQGNSAPSFWDYAGAAVSNVFSAKGWGLALGTNYAPGGLTMVGENGPELVNLPRGSQVYSHSDTNKMLSSGGGSVTVGSVNIYNQMDEQKFLKDIAWRLAIS